jgi:hypothetical protein
LEKYALIAMLHRPLHKSNMFEPAVADLRRSSLAFYLAACAEPLLPDAF